MNIIWRIERTILLQSNYLDTKKYNQNNIPKISIMFLVYNRNVFLKFAQKQDFIEIDIKIFVIHSKDSIVYLIK